MSERITVILPTYNRSGCVNYLIENSFKKYTGSLFAFEIHDSSDDNLTEEICAVSGLENLKYRRYSPAINGDVKTVRAIEEVKTGYYLLLGDGVVIDFNALETHLNSIGFENFGVTGFRSCEGLSKSVRKDYDVSGKTDICVDNNEYFFKYFWALTLYGSTVVNTAVVKAAREQSKKYVEAASPFMHDCILFEGLALSGLRCAFTFVDFVTYNPLKKSSGWIASGQAVEFFCYRYYESVKMLPPCYDVSRKFLTGHNKYSKLFSFKSVLSLRADGNITFAKVKKYKFYIKKTVDRPSKVYFALLFPGFMLRFLKKVYKKIKRH